MFKKLAIFLTLWGALAATTAQARHYHSHHGFYHGVPYAWGWYSAYNYVWAPTVTPWGYSYYGYYGYQPQYANFGAISYDVETGRVGYAGNLPSRWRAVRAANRFCGTAGCRAVVWVQGGCAAVAKSENSDRIGWGWDASKYRARSRAIRGCRQGGNQQCKIQAWVCTSR